ncbi:hypothetical protein UA08_05422 [Talaromyces atroroseus]|uniref:Zn(2)-C6 fungal-type domain-containing protein n=1 Tax=Talaromyces atroroseus TaxID=1441469 RepID=A0A225AQK2_TALAT|nr:hypothetical protein UA08_05422 [Talaromyces atroroseus]OKL59528.1 hypothetical protein UA08_05422 [Talaromyces atroroseus]
MATQQAVATDRKMEPRLTTTSPQLNRSCESCRSLKVRCLPDTNVPNQCQRCVKAKRPCIFVAPQRRRPRKRTDSRVAQLEKEMAAMRTVLKGRHIVIEENIKEDSESGRAGDAEEPDAVDFGPQVTEKPQPTQFQDVQFTTPFNRPFLHDTSQSPGYRSSPQMSGDGNSSLSTPALTLNSIDKGNELDVIDRGVISLSTAEDLVSLFINDLLVYFPFIVFPTNTTARHLRTSKPILFLAILAASSIAVDDSLATALNREMLSLYAQRFFFRGEKSLEMVQVLLLMNIYYLPPQSPSQIQTYQYPHIAATMALEIGIASKKRIPRTSRENQQRQSKPVGKFDEQIAEQARTILTCYHLTSNVAMRARQPNMLPFNDWMKECIRLLSSSPIATDKWYASWFGLQVITDEAMSSFGLDDNSSTALLSETRVNSVLRLFDKKIEEWKEDLDPEHLTVPMMLEYQYTTLVVYEIGIGEGYRDPDAIKRQYYTLPAPDGDNCAKRPTEPLSAMRLDLTVRWMHAAQGLLNTFLSCDVHSMRKMPNLTYMRTVLGLMVLLKIYFSVKSGVLGEIIEPDTLNIEGYLESLTQRLAEASADCKYPIPSRWLRVVGGKSRDWFERFQRHHMDQEAQAQDDQLNASSNSKANVAPSLSTVSNAWNGGIVPTPTPTGPPGANVSLTREYILQHQQQQQQQQEKAEYRHQPNTFGANLGYTGLSAVQGSINAANNSNTTTTTTTNTFPDYNQATAWIRSQQSSSSPSDPSMQQQVDSHTGGYHISPQDVWAFHHQQQQQQYINLSNHHQAFPSAMSGSDHDISAMEMEFDWVPEHGIFQLPSF